MRKNSAGFTILEVILAITVLTLAAGGSFILISQTIGSVSVIQSRLIASYLIQEGLEIARNIRDSNWLKNQTWDQNLGAGDYEADYNDLSLTECLSPCDYDHDYNLHFLKIPDQGFYNYDLGDDTKFKRKITISKESEEPDRLKVSVEVLWKEKGQIRSLPAQEYLYNWYEMPLECYLYGIPQTCDGAAATALGCTAGEEACTRCDNGSCGNYTSDQHGCEAGYECNVNGYCISPDVCTGIADNTQVPGCDEACQACQTGTCGFADVDTDPAGDDCSATDCYTGNCNGSGACGYYTTEERNCSACKTCQGATSGSCLNMTIDQHDTEGSNTCGGCYWCDGNGICLLCNWYDTGTDSNNMCSGWQSQTCKPSTEGLSGPSAQAWSCPTSAIYATHSSCNLVRDIFRCSCD